MAALLQQPKRNISKCIELPKCFRGPYAICQKNGTIYTSTVRLKQATHKTVIKTDLTGNSVEEGRAFANCHN